MLIRKDHHGLYIRSRWYNNDETEPAYRPGDFPGYSHAQNTSDAGLQEGDALKTSHVTGEPFVCIHLTDGSKVYWGSFGRTQGDFYENEELKK